MQNLGEIYTRNARLYPDRTALIFEDHRETFRELNERVNRLVHAMQARGVVKGDRVAILAKNCHQYWEAYGLAEKGGIILVPLNWRLVARELKYLLTDSGSKAVLVSREYVPVINSLREELPAVSLYVCLDGEAEGMESYEAMLAAASPEEPGVEISRDDICYFIYSSGTTGLPKGIMLTHGGQLENAIAQMAEVRSGVYDVYLSVIPLFHSGGKGVTLAHFFRGCTIVILRDFDARKVLEAIQEHKVSVMFVVPSMVAFMLDVPGFEQYDTSSLRCLFYAGSAMPQGLLVRAIKAFGPIFAQGYGLAETGPLATFLSPEDHKPEGTPAEVRRLTSCGKPALNAEVRVVTEDGRDVKPGEVGEFIIRSNRLMVGYWNNPEKTASTLKNGWCYTGDMGTVDEEGYFYIVDRKADLIISGGENIYPREIEEVLYTHPAVREAAVIGVPDDVWGESVKAFIAVREGATITEQEVIDYCKQHLASYKKPRSVEFLPELPKNPSGKVLKTVLRDRHWVGRERKV